MSKKDRKDLTLIEKVALIDLIEKLPPNTSRRKLSEISGVPKSTVSRILQHREKLRNDFMMLDHRKRMFRKRRREGKDPDVEEALNQWYTSLTEQGIRISSSTLKQKSEEIAKGLAHYNFKATSGWLSRWKIRYGIKSNKMLKPEDWKSVRVPYLLQTYSPDDIYNAEETGLLYRATPDGSLTYNPGTLTDLKKSLDHVTVLCCLNMSGTDRRKPLIIGKHINPQCFKGINMDNLPVQYRANEHAWMTSTIFKDWLINWDAELEQESRKILLILDTCPAHPHFDCLKNIQLEFLAPNTVSPMKIGIIKKWKNLYRLKLANWIMESIEDNSLTSASTAKEIGLKIDLLRAIQFISDCWKEINTNTIKHFFSQCGFKDYNFEIKTEANDGNGIVIYIQNFDTYSCIDDKIICCKPNEDFEEVIILPGEKEEEDEEEQKQQPLPPSLKKIENTLEHGRISNADAMKFVNGLKMYFMQEENENSPMSALEICSNYVKEQIVKRARLIPRVHSIFNV